jgi:hypothetical protein
MSAEGGCVKQTPQAVALADIYIMYVLANGLI